VKLTQRLAVQNLEIYHDIDDLNSESNFKNLYHNSVLVREQCGQEERHGDLYFQVFGYWSSKFSQVVVPNIYRAGCAIQNMLIYWRQACTSFLNTQNSS
jgi:hypothetical protein